MGLLCILEIFMTLPFEYVSDDCAYPLHGCLCQRLLFLVLVLRYRGFENERRPVLLLLLRYYKDKP